MYNYEIPLTIDTGASMCYVNESLFTDNILSSEKKQLIRS